MINRRSFLKVLGAMAPVILAPKIFSSIDQGFNGQDSSKPNIIVILFDAMSARNLSVYDYARQTSPNLEWFAQHATVYHSHHSSGNFTIPGTASLLTGTYPWTHRAINHSGAIRRSLVGNNIFRALGEDYHRLAFPQNDWSSLIVSQFEEDIDTLLPSSAFSELEYLISNYFPNDRAMAERALDDFVFKTNQSPVSLILGFLQDGLLLRNEAQLDSQGYPRGLPFNQNYPIYFRLEEVMKDLAALLPEQASPFFAYLHLFPPHAPYRPSRKFNKMFMDDGYVPPVKPNHRFSSQFSADKINVARQSYDQYIASVDEVLGQLLDNIKGAGLFENSYIVITSDHGEMFERGEKAHETPMLYEPLVHIPLIISAPGQTTRHDVFSPTNAVDLLPTFAKVADQPIPSWCEGMPLPGLGGVEDYERGIYTVEAKLNSAFSPLNKASVSFQKGNYKLIYYTGYEAEDAFELYDLSEDPEELEDLYASHPSFVKKMKDEMLESFFASNKLYNTR